LVENEEKKIMEEIRELCEFGRRNVFAVGGLANSVIGGKWGWSQHSHHFRIIGNLLEETKGISRARVAKRNLLKSGEIANKRGMEEAGQWSLIGV